MPEPIRASSKRRGPDQGSHADPRRCAAATSVAPGSATAGQPASETSAPSRPPLTGFSQSRSRGLRRMSDLVNVDFAQRQRVLDLLQERARRLRVLRQKVGQSACDRHDLRPAAPRRALLRQSDRAAGNRVPAMSMRRRNRDARSREHRRRAGSAATRSGRSGHRTARASPARCRGTRSSRRRRSRTAGPDGR